MADQSGAPDDPKTEPGPRDGARSVDEKDLFQLVVESATDFAIFTMDGRGIATSWNTGSERLFGYPESEILGTSCDVIFIPEDIEAGAPDRERARAAAEGRALDERWHQRRDGSHFWASGLLMPLHGGKGFVKIVRDRTEQHRAEERVRENEERFRLLATSIPQLVFRSRHDGERTWASPQWIEFSGLSPDESLGFGWLAAIHPEDRPGTEAVWRDARRSGEYYVEHRVRRVADGEYRWHQTRVRPIKPEDPVSSDWVGTMTDIHDLRSLKDRQQVLMAELQHRTRNLLAVVESIAAHTLRKSASLAEFGPEFSARLRALSRIQALLARVDHQDIDLCTLVAAELAAHHRAGDATEAEDKVVVDGPPVVLPAGSAQALGLAFHELVTNAVKHGALARPSGRLIITWRIERDGSEPRVVLDWRESGVAIAATGPERRRGYGSELIERALPYQLGAETKLEFGPDGVSCVIAVPVRKAHEAINATKRGRPRDMEADRRSEADHD